MKKNSFKSLLMITWKFSRILLLTFIFAGIAHATNTIAQKTSDVKITLQLKDVSITDALKAIENQSPFTFNYSATLRTSNRLVTLHVNNISVDKVLESLEKEYGLQFRQVNNVIAVNAKKLQPDKITSGIDGQKQSVTISGTVTDAKTGEPLPGVNVIIEGTSKGTATDKDGKYSLVVDNTNSNLLFSFMGYTTSKINCNGQITINVTLSPDQKELKEVVVIGYGTSDKKDVTSSISSIKAKDFNSGVTSSPIQLLQGKVAGLTITRDGNPNNAPSIIMRGPSTLRSGAMEPYYIIDGVPGVSLNLVAPEDIISIDVLKDASAAAIYGSKASNGIIIITTKKGNTGQAKVNYNAYIALEKISNKIDMLSSDEYRSFLSKNNLVIDPVDEDNNNIDWQDEVTRTGISHNHNLSINGGNSGTTYFAGVDYLKNEGIIKGSAFERIIFRGNVEQKTWNDRLKLGFSITNSISDSKTIPDQVYINMLNYMPTVNIKNADGTFKENFNHPGAKNPVALIEQNTIEARNKTLLASSYANLKIIEGLNYNLNISFQNAQTNSGIYYSKKSSLAQGYNGKAKRSSYESETKILENYLSYHKTINKHDFTVLFGYSWQEDYSGNGFQAVSSDFVSDETGYNNLTLGTPSTLTTDYDDIGIKTLRMISGYSRLNYQFDNRYIFQATIRRDGSSAFGKNKQWGTFPAVSAGWQIANEPFMKNQKIFDNLKLRVGYGISGNSMGFDPLVTILRYGKSGYFYYNGKWVSSIQPTQNENPDFKWEETAMLNTGIDFSILKGRVSGSVDYYKKETKDLIWSYPVSSTQYFVSSLTANVGKMENKGFEIVLSAIPFTNQHFNWSTSFNIAFNKNKITSLSNSQYKLDHIFTVGIGDHGQSGNYAQIIKEGYPVGQFYLWKYAGHDANGVSQFYMADSTLSANPTTPNDHFYTKNAQPKAVGGWYNTITWNNLSLDFLFRFVTGNTILNATMANLNYPAEATHFNMPRMTLSEPIKDDRAHYVSDRYLEDGDFIRLDNITVAYTFHFNKPAIKNIRVYSTVNNVFVITNYKGLDPEINLGGITPGVDNDNYYPKTRSFILGVNVEF
jgi:TonB-dependent starch-binding outer membrane protein SusC